MDMVGDAGFLIVNNKTFKMLSTVFVVPKYTALDEEKVEL